MEVESKPRPIWRASEFDQEGAFVRQAGVGNTLAELAAAVKPQLAVLYRVYRHGRVVGDGDMLLAALRQKDPR